MRRFALILFWLVAAVALAFATVALAPALAQHVSDKILHACVFVLLALLGSVAYSDRHPVKMFVWLAAFGGAIELIQMIPALHRDSDWRDWLADCVAAGATLIVVALCRRMLRPVSVDAA